jgi:hypothetical protein
MTAEEILERTVLTGREWRAVGELAKAKMDFEPLAMRANIGPIVIERLVQYGIAEVGPSAPRFNQSAFPIGYRLSRLGRMVLARGRKPPQPLRVPEPRTSELRIGDKRVTVQRAAPKRVVLKRPATFRAP